MKRAGTSDGASDDLISAAGRPFESSDAVRSAVPLRHARGVTFDRPLELELGGVLPEVTVVYETYGTLNAARDNAVLICHALSGDSHVARHDADDDPGWWDLVVGPGKSIDTDRFFVICPNILGGCRGSTGPSHVNPQTQRRYASDFPTITIADTVEVHRRLLDHLQIDALHAVVGGSMGGHQAITWAIRHPNRVRNCILIATSPRLSSQAIAFDVVARNSILHDPHFHRGHYYDRAPGPAVGLALARMLGHITYLSREAMTAKFDPGRMRPRDVATDFEKKFSVGAYLAYQGDSFVERFDANSYVTLSMAMDLFDLGETPQQHQAALAPSTCRWLVISYSSDWLFPPQQSRQIVDALLANDKPVSYCEVASASGHDAFLLADSVETYGALVRGFLSPGDGKLSDNQNTGGGIDASVSSIFRGGRLDHATIVDLIPPGSSVLDLGCAIGLLLGRLSARGHQRLLGVEVDPRAIVACVNRGLNIVHLDLAHRLTAFRDGQFDVVVLSQLLQCIPDTQQIIEEIVRVGSRAVISFPNFAYRRLREMFNEQGRAPKAPGPFGYEWYATPNRRFPSIRDVEDLCRVKGITIEKQVCLNSDEGGLVFDDPNLNATDAIMVLKR